MCLWTYPRLSVLWSFRLSFGFPPFKVTLQLQRMLRGDWDKVVDMEDIEKGVREVVDDMEVEKEVVGDVQQDETFWME